jgi:molecular chaperone GrpE
MRSVAELENFRKRSANDRSRLLKYQYEALLRDLLPVLDNMERALDHSQSSGETGAFVEGIQMIAGMFKNLLDRYGVTEIASLDEPFDPNFHEAVSSAPVPGKEANMVVQALEKGYMYQDRLLRPSKVVISSDTGQ